MEFIKALQNSFKKQRRKAGTRAYYNSGEVYLSRLFGYQLVDGRYEPDPRYRDHIMTIYSLLADGSTLPEIKAALDLMGARDSSNNRYSISRIVGIAERPIYAGYLIQRGRLVKVHNLTPIITLDVWKKAERQLKIEKKKIS
jgi:hypothetical protein